MLQNHATNLLIVLATGLGLLAAPSISAQTGPSLIPTRDVVVTYRIVSSEATTTLDMAWLAAAAKLRADVPGVGWSVADHRAGTGFIVIEEAKRIMEMPPRVLQGQLGPPAGARFTQEGTQRIAGTACTDWRYEGSGQEGRICLSADGIMLRSQVTAGGPAGITGGLEATHIRYEAQDPARFAVPEGYQRVQPRMPRERPVR
ncbi:hypothetical protein [Sediminicoccus sp. KRV36]|uniref:hypothetical protein n=1 Tax=Sediminicoccus sp. KRV36 TaxID=3133721 RepID=UPI00200C6AF9|nr:hypothetical protein [Sediminicoccus rosea]UPY36855.1 hypothetical protein LHU95_21985 [Sediminicoccus rosea]